MITNQPVDPSNFANTGGIPSICDTVAGDVCVGDVCPVDGVPLAGAVAAVGIGAGAGGGDAFAAFAALRCSLWCFALCFLYTSTIFFIAALNSSLNAKKK